MPKHNNKKGSQMERVSGRVVITFTNTSGTSSGTYVDPSFSSLVGTQTIAGGEKLAALALLFQYFRFTRFKWRLSPSATNAYVISGYTPDATTAVPTYSGVVGMPVTSDLITRDASDVQSPSVPAKVSVPKAVLLDQNLKWWKTTHRTGEDLEFYTQGSLWVGTSTTYSNQIQVIDLEYTCEFKDFIAPADLPLVPALRNGSRRSVADNDEDEKSAVMIPDELESPQLESPRQSRRSAARSSGFQQKLTIIQTPAKMLGATKVSASS
jgi:hypothetical protein